MNVLSGLFEAGTTNGFVAELMTEVVARKLGEKGISLSRRQRERIRKQLAAGDFSAVEVKTPSWRFWEKEIIDLNLTDAESEKIDEAIENWIKGLPELTDSLSSETADQVLAVLKRDWPRQRRQEQRELGAFLKHLNEQWGAPLNLLGMFITIVREIGENFNTHLRTTEVERPYLVEAMTRLHARGCQVASEITVLLQNGYADGAMARWRTLHEIAVVSLFIFEGGEELAERYVLHEAEESRRIIRQYQRYAERLQYEPYSDDEVNTIEERCARLEQRFGEAYEGEYGWAAERLNTKKPTIALIEQAVGVDHLRPFYRMASHNVHANPKGVFFKLGLADEAPILLSGCSDFGLADPGQNTAISLMQVTCGLVNLSVNFDAVVCLKLLERLSHEVAEGFVAVQKNLEAEGN